MMGGQIGVSHSQSEGCSFAFFVKTRKVPMKETEVPSNRDEIDAAVNFDPMIISVVPIPDPKSDPTTHPDDNSPPASGRSRVLVVEDNLINQRVLCTQLRNRGYSVVAANNGEEALAALRNATSSADSLTADYFDIVLCDIEMPIMGGIDCVMEIRRLERSGELPGPTPVIAVTANARNEHVKTAIQAGMSDVTTKPYRMEELVSQIKRFTNLRNLPEVNGTASRPS
jgi:CheY-like chemotaxis protein